MNLSFHIERKDSWSPSSTEKLLTSHYFILRRQITWVISKTEFTWKDSWSTPHGSVANYRTPCIPMIFFQIILRARQSGYCVSVLILLYRSAAYFHIRCYLNSGEPFRKNSRVILTACRLRIATSQCLEIITVSLPRHFRNDFWIPSVTSLLCIFKPASRTWRHLLRAYYFKYIFARSPPHPPSAAPALCGTCKFVKRYFRARARAPGTFGFRIIFLDSCILRDVLQSVLGRHNRGWHERSTLALYPGASFYGVCFFKQAALSSNGPLGSVLCRLPALHVSSLLKLSIIRSRTRFASRDKRIVS